MKKIIEIFLFVLITVSSYAHAQFEAVYVTMESGEEIPLTELPWFRHAYFIWGVAPQKFHADDGDWIVYAPPKFCPSAYDFWVLWGQGENQSKKIENEKERTKRKCSDTQVGKWLSDLPEIKQICKCKLILQTTNVLDKNNKIIKWKSHDDSILKNENLTLRFDLIDKKEKLPIVISLGSFDSRIYSFRGDKLCEMDAYIPKSFDPKFNLILDYFSKPPFPIKCINNLSGKIDFNKMSWNILSNKFSGTIKINFDNGERYEIKSF
jgi:hypothetical protein